MSFNKVYVPSLQELKEQIKNDPQIVNYYLRADMLMGPSDSITYLHQVSGTKNINEVISNDSNDQMIRL